MRKDRSDVVVGKLNEEVIRQLRDLAKSEAAAGYTEAEPADDDGVRLPSSWVSSEYCATGTGHGGFEAFNPEEACLEAATMVVPSSEV